MAKIDLDLVCDLPWDFSVEYQGVVHPVKLPSAEQLGRLEDVARGNSKGWMVFGDLFSELTGIDRDAVNGLAAEAIIHFFRALFGAMKERQHHERQLGIFGTAAAAQGASLPN